MKATRLAAILAGILVLGAAPATKTAPTPTSALTELKAGNERFASHHATHPHQTAARRTELAASQHPHAVILACADSRVAPEIVFDKGLGDLFTVRVAGNIAGDPEIASIEYAVEHLHVPLIVVMGHQSCGAVGAAIEGGEAPGHLPALIQAITPSVEKARSMQGDLSDNAIRLNVEAVVAQLAASHPILAEHIAEGKLKIVGGVYSLETGRVAWLAQNTP
ncbi:MAG TPA: carbonic anhydrase [Candidatus Eisenbacteria bacterium]|nr:carbonic anhydrase [Candidatus Eisenbacteria bacterium]